MKYEDIEYNKPFIIVKPNKDITVWRKDEHGLQIYFHVEEFWCNPPTDSQIEWRAVKAIEKYGIKYIPVDYVDRYLEQGSWENKLAYSVKIADEALKS